MSASSLRLFEPPDRPVVGDPELAIPLLSEVELPQTHWPYYSRKLVCWWLLDVPVLQVPSLHVGNPAVPAYRLTPASFAWFWQAVERLCEKPGASDSARWAVGVLLDMDAWLTGHGLADEVRRARTAAAPALVEPPPLAAAPEGKRDYSFARRANL